ncbi:hypothetical protein [Vibrio phage vB_pir03]|nr:hypothetical protein [Vibrio phage vB_pir03]
MEEFFLFIFFSFLTDRDTNYREKPVIGRG